MLAADRAAHGELDAARTEEYIPDQEPLATWWRQLSPGTNYWRCQVPARHLPGQVLNFEKGDLVSDETYGAIIPRQKGAAIWPFAGNTTRGILMAAQREQGFRVLMEADDNYILGADLRISQWADTVEEADGGHSYEAHAKLCKWVDGIIVSTENLAGHYSKLNKNVYVCPNSIDVNDWPEPEKPNDGILRIGWAAAHNHIPDVPLVARALKWAAEQKDVEVYVYGIGDVVKFRGGVQSIPFTDDLAAFRKSLSLCDVHICPVRRTPWSAGKSDIKALEAAMAGAWPIVASAEPYKPWHDRTMTCSSAKDWQRALRWVVLHRDEISQLAAEARDYVLSERTIGDSVHLWREAITDK